jgi:hypothetical protein
MSKKNMWKGKTYKSILSRRKRNYSKGTTAASVSILGHPNSRRNQSIQKKLEQITDKCDATKTYNASIEGKELERVVVTVINNSKAKWRSSSSLARELNINKGLLTAKLQDMNSRGKLVCASVKNKESEDLFSTVEHYKNKTGLGSRILSIITNDII